MAKHLSRLLGVDVPLIHDWVGGKFDAPQPGKVVMLLEVITAFSTVIFLLSDFVSMKESMRPRRRGSTMPNQSGATNSATGGLGNEKAELRVSVDPDARDRG